MSYPVEQRRYREQFRMQRTSARARGLAWNLTFDEWLEIWQSSGKLEQRGRGKGKYVMSRNGDIGPYCVGNVSIQLFEQNISDAYRNVPEKCAPARLRGRGRGWTYQRGAKKPFVVVSCGKYIGSFITEIEAVDAYRRATEAAIAAAFPY
ncbi:hypothetical protein [Achromobacter spanius]|uniref:AP2/ERF domain-containing protein n=1 Tax=Achromobacter spanius TaxID=217203 RepID=A0AAW3I7V5_9BURK|nr:hypothetical protein [Achromobacter spanius]KNE28192.1 hypothetical protein AFM18_08495 [Achromobacter spanius]